MIYNWKRTVIVLCSKLVMSFGAHIVQAPRQCSGVPFPQNLWFSANPAYSIQCEGGVSGVTQAVLGHRLPRAPCQTAPRVISEMVKEPSGLYPAMLRDQFVAGTEWGLITCTTYALTSVFSSDKLFF